MDDNATKRSPSKETLTRPINPDETGKSVAGRWHFLQAIARHNPALLASLRDEVFDECEGLGYEPMSTAPKPIQDADYGRMLAWAESKGISDEWLIEDLQYTIMAWVAIAREKGWEVIAYSTSLPAFSASNEPVVPEFIFTPTNPHPMPRKPLSEEDRRELEKNKLVLRMYESGTEYESVAEMKARLQAQFAAQLDDYAFACKKRLESDAISERNARWTALRMSGKTCEEISRKQPEFRGPKYEDPAQTVRRATVRFAAQIGLTYFKLQNLKRSTKN